MKLISTVLAVLALAMPASALQLKTIAAFDASIKRGSLLSQGSSFYTTGNGFTRHRLTLYNGMQADTFACTQASITKLARNFNAVSLIISAKQRLFCYKPARAKVYASLLDKDSNIAIKTSNAIAYAQQEPLLYAGIAKQYGTQTTATLLFDGNTLIASRYGNSFIKANTLLLLPANKYANIDIQGNVTGPFAIAEPYLVLGKKVSKSFLQVCSAKDNEITVRGRSLQWCNLGKIGDEVIVTNPAGETRKYYIEREL